MLLFLLFFFVLLINWFIDFHSHSHTMLTSWCTKTCVWKVQKFLGICCFFVVVKKKNSIQLLIHEFVGVSKQSLDLPKETFLTKSWITNFSRNLCENRAPGRKKEFREDLSEKMNEQNDLRELQMIPEYYKAIPKIAEFIKSTYHYNILLPL